MNKTEKWMFHYGEDEQWDGDDYDTREEAIKYGREYATEYAEEQEMDDNELKEFLASGYFYVGEVCKFDPYVDADYVIDCISENAYEFAGEFSESYLSAPGLNASKEKREQWKEKVDNLQERLTSVFKEWAKETGNEPTFFSIEGTEKVYIREE